MKQQKAKKQKPAQKQAPKSSLNKNTFYISILMLVTAIVFFNTLQNDFTNWDDDIYLFSNNYIKELSSTGIYNIFSESYFGNYHPLTTLTYAVEYKLFGFNASYFHFTNYLLHLINTLLVFLLFRQFTKRMDIPFITALLFALHPMHVESVAWISERKDVLYSFFYLASLIFMVRYIKAGFKNFGFYILAFVLFLFSLMSKSAAVVLPVSFLISIYFLTKKITVKDILLCLPFFVLSVVFGIVALQTQNVATNDATIIYTGLNRVLIVFYAVGFYIIRFIFPYNFSAFHSLPNATNNLLPSEFYAAPLILIIVIALVFISKKEFRQVMIFGLLFFMVNMALVIQIIPLGQAIVSERYTYIPYIGLSFIAAFGFIHLKESKNSTLVTVAGLLFMGFLTVSTFLQNKVWANSITLWSKAIEVNPQNSVAYNHRGNALAKNTNYIKAIEDYDKAIEFDKKTADPFNNRGLAKAYLGQHKEAISDYNEAIKIKPGYAEAYFNRGNSKGNTGDLQGALGDLNKAIAINATYLDAYINRGNIKGRLEDTKGALEDFNKATEINPNYPIAFYSRGLANSTLKNYNEALKDYNKAIKLDAKFALAYLNRGNAYFFLNRINDACLDWKTASSLGEKRGQLNVDQYCK